ncbi:hypothetical protein BDF14DRAFT_1823221 [Spinellus fusiger]|nr:hypothetical protein BDF14DRAFT_1823221 [Spinellus fusiger]
MGKHKSTFNVYASYIDRLIPSVPENVPLPDSMRVSTLIEQMGKERSWTEEQIESDIDILYNQRLSFISDLRALSDHSWKVIPVLPLVRDLMRRAVDPEWEKNSEPVKSKSEKSDKRVKNEKNEESSVDLVGSLGSLSAKPSTGRAIEPVSANRIRVRTAQGVYECNRFCPHKGVDLVTWGNVMGNILVCTKHNWKFGLDGQDMGKGKNINACKVNDW